MSRKETEKTSFLQALLIMFSTRGTMVFLHSRETVDTLAEEYARFFCQSEQTRVSAARREEKQELGCAQCISTAFLIVSKVFTKFQSKQTSMRLMELHFPMG